MKKLYLTAASALAIAMASPAYAETSANTHTATKAEIERTHNQQDAAVVTESELENTWDNAKENTKDAANSFGNAVGNMVDDTKAAVGEMSDEVEDAVTADASATVNMDMTATNLIGKKVVNADGESVASIKDIIVDKDGNATHVILADGEWLGLGKMVAYNYDIISNLNAEGEVLTSLSEAQMDNAAEFSYSPVDNKAVVVMPSDSYSVAQILDAELVAQDNETLAEVDNIHFLNGEADKIIVGYNKILGMGGEQMTIDFDEAQLSKDTNSDIRFRLSAADSASFKTRLEANAKLNTK